jgi:DNA-binding PadR family transcriptional regulator
MTDTQTAMLANPVQAESGAVPAEYALLGLILMAGGQTHGYALMRELGRDPALAATLGLESALIYYYLKKLARRGWVDVLRADQPSRPARRECHISAAGEAAFWSWISAPCERPEQAGTEFLLKLYLVERLAPSRAVHLVSAQYAVCRDCRAALAGQLLVGDARTASEHANELESFSRLALQLRLMQLQALMGWLDATGHRRGSQR